MKYLNDKEILEWNNRIKSDFIVNPVYTSNINNPSISIYNIHEILDYRLKIDPEIKYYLSFSVAENRKDQFEILLNKLRKEEFKTKIILCDHNSRQEKSLFIENLDQDEVTISEDKHTLYSVNYIRYTYKFNTNYSKIIAYTSYIHDAIKFFSSIWGYNKNGQEICLVKYKVGDIVNLTDNKSDDYLVVDYDYNKLYGEYRIDYKISKILSEKSPIVNYGEIVSVSESTLSSSRNNIIDKIINK